MGGRARRAAHRHPVRDPRPQDLRRTAADRCRATCDGGPAVRLRQVRRWGQAVDACDGFIFVTPEYNHGVPGAFKNAVDSLGPEWFGKTVGFVSYGADGGVRAVEQWRQIVANMQMFDVRAQVALSLFSEFGPGGFTPAGRRPGELSVLLDQLITLTELHGRSRV
ncbi:NADPH-dependent FMN reductase [Mycolicibacterium diernhoferi]|uniref:NADPH-dependent FMN reductase n=1 Tax=Mycolicibacterium diernhoferi TaxID=1801 RepID=UPI002D21D878|nr:NAD(P)H-dependent oxidoreductase [Mycolicibacterium diernhoferi]